MIRYALRRSPGGRRYSSTDRTVARLLELADAPPTLSDEAVAAMTDPNGIRVVVDVLFELESNRLSRPLTPRLLAAGVEVAPASGSLPSLVDGIRNSSTARPAVRFPSSVTVDDDPVVELTWTDTRPVNVVEIHGDPVVGQITAARVDVRDAYGIWIANVASGSGAGRLAIPFPRNVGDAGVMQATGVRVHIEESESTGGIAVVEVDPMWILDVSDDVETLEVEWSREADPGTSPSPVGHYEASTLLLTLDDSAGFWNPATNASLDIGHRVEVAVGVVYPDPVTREPVEELLPAGVFYSDPFDTASDAVTVTINAVDRLGRRAGVAVSEEVAVAVPVGTLIRDLARKYLDLDAEQVVVTPAIDSTVIPYAYPVGDLGTYLADVAKATGGTIHVDPLERLVLARRTDTTDEAVAEFRDDSSLLSFRRPPTYDVTASIVTLTAAPLAPAAVADLWAMPSGGISIASKATHLLVARYDEPPGLNGFVTGIVADGSYTITAAAFYSDRAELSIRNNENRTLVVADLRIRGNPLVESSLTARAEHAPSIARYGPREFTVEARLIQTQAQLEAMASVLLDAFRSLDDEGNRRLPDLEFDALGVLHLAAGDRVSLSFPAKGLGGDYAILSRKLVYSEGAILLNGVKARETLEERFLVLDQGILDDVFVVGY